MSQNVPQCPTFDDSHSPDNPSPPATDAAHPPESPLSDLQQRALDLMVTGRPDTQVAAALNVSRRTLHRWRHDDPAFKRELDRRRAELLDHAADRFRTLLDAALDTLGRHVADPYTVTAHRAARTLLTLAHIGAKPNPDPPATPVLRARGDG